VALPLSQPSSLELPLLCGASANRGPPPPPPPQQQQQPDLLPLITRNNKLKRARSLHLHRRRRRSHSRRAHTTRTLTITATITRPARRSLPLIVTTHTVPRRPACRLARTVRIRVHQCMANGQFRLSTRACPTCRRVGTSRCHRMHRSCHRPRRLQLEQRRTVQSFREGLLVRFDI